MAEAEEKSDALGNIPGTLAIKTGILLEDLVKSIPFAKLLIDRENYSLDEVLLDLMQVVIISSMSHTNGFREGINGALVGLCVSARYYNELRKDFAEDIKSISGYLDNRLRGYKLYSLIKNSAIAIDRIIADRHSLPLFVFGWAIADGLVLAVNESFEKEAKSIFNLSTPQHAIVPYSLGNIYLRFRQEYHLASTGEMKGRNSFDSIVNIGLMVATAIAWESYEILEYNFWLSLDTFGDSVAHFLGWRASVRYSPEGIINSGKSGLTKAGAYLRSKYLS
jgi:hypothetical protein